MSVRNSQRGDGLLLGLLCEENGRSNLGIDCEVFLPNPVRLQISQRLFEEKEKPAYPKALLQLVR